MTQFVVDLTIDGEPISKQRPRVGLTNGGKAYTPKQTKAAQAVIGWSVRAHCRSIAPQSGAFGIDVTFYTKSRQRRDVDNMAKLIMDALTGIVWHDDSQVEDLRARVKRTDPNPRTVLKVFALEDTTPFHDCQNCSKKFRTYPSWPWRKFCSRSCRDKSFENGVNVPCSQCGKEIHRAEHRLDGKRKFFCSISCKSEFMTVVRACVACGAEFRTPKSLQKKSACACSSECRAELAKRKRVAGAVGICAGCGGPTSDKRRIRCRPCHLRLGCPGQGFVRSAQ